jgi:hypothetical protein
MDNTTNKMEQRQLVHGAGFKNKNVSKSLFAEKTERTGKSEVSSKVT